MLPFCAVSTKQLPGRQLKFLSHWNRMQLSLIFILIFPRVSFFFRLQNTTILRPAISDETFFGQKAVFSYCLICSLPLSFFFSPWNYLQFEIPDASNSLFLSLRWLFFLPDHVANVLLRSQCKMLDLKISLVDVFFFREWQWRDQEEAKHSKRHDSRNGTNRKKNLSQQLFVVFGWSLLFHFLSLAHVVDLNCMKIASRWLRSCIAMHFRQPKKKQKRFGERSSKTEIERTNANQNA